MASSQDFVTCGDVLELLRDLLDPWYGSDEEKAQLLSQIKIDDSKATPDERLILQKLRSAASEAEWQRLEWIAIHLEEQEKRWWVFWQTMGNLRSDGAFEEAEHLALRSGNNNRSTAKVTL